MEPEFIFWIKGDNIYLKDELISPLSVALRYNAVF